MSALRHAALLACLLSPIAVSAEEEEAVQLPEYNLASVQNAVCRVLIEVERYHTSGVFDRNGSPVFKEIRIMNLDTKQSTLHSLEAVKSSDSDQVRLQLKQGKYAIVGVVFEYAASPGSRELPLSVGFEIGERFLGKATKLHIRPQDSME